MMASPLQRHSDSGSAASHRSNSIELAHIAEPHQPTGRVLRHSQPYHTGGGCQYVFPPRCRRAGRVLGFDAIGGLPIAVSQLVNLFREFQFLGEHVPGLSHS
jgi:hypothetical protein